MSAHLAVVVGLDQLLELNGASDVASLADVDEVQKFLRDGEVLQARQPHH